MCNKPHPDNMRGGNLYKVEWEEENIARKKSGVVREFTAVFTETDTDYQGRLRICFYDKGLFLKLYYDSILTMRELPET